MLKEVEVIAPFVRRAMLCGSRVTCNPAPTDTDQDVIVLVEDIEATATREGRPSSAYKAYFALATALHAAGYVCGGSGTGDDEFESWTKGEINLILTADCEFYERFVAATTVARELNVLDKDLRRALFRAVLYSEACYYPGPHGRPLEPDDGSPF